MAKEGSFHEDLAFFHACTLTDLPVVCILNVCCIALHLFHACVMRYLTLLPPASPCSGLRPASWSLFPPCACWYTP